MCGITGCIDISRSTPAESLTQIVGSMAKAVWHRGPDDSGVWVDAACGVGLGFQRLAIIDVSPAGSQPMVSHNGRWVVAFNGEIYNHQALRTELEGNREDQDYLMQNGPGWRGHSDTETMIEAISAWGVETAVKRFNGMFAFALWDRQQRMLHLVRDCLGKKPLYYGWMGRTFLFGSELKALRRHPDFSGEVHRDVLAAYLRHNYIPSPYSIYQNIFKLEPGTILSFDFSSTDRCEPTVNCYWSAKTVAEQGVMTGFAGSSGEVSAELEKLLRDSVALRMMADVPLGALLSGGMDSSLVVALMQAQSSRPVKTFSIGFHEPGYNEAEHAKAVARHLGTDHTELYVTPEEAMAVIPQLPTLYDEPFADSSAIPTFLVCQMARQYVTVALSGDGGDELFGGYSRYFTLHDYYRKIAAIPGPLRRILARTFRMPSSQHWEVLSRFCERFWSADMATRLTPDTSLALSKVLTAERPESLYRFMVSYWRNPTALVLGATEAPSKLSEIAQWTDIPHVVQKAMYLDTVSYLPDDILVKVDRASMGKSLEVRCPLLDYRVVEFAWRVPFRMKVHRGEGKRILSDVLSRYVPEELFQRPKKGFRVPIEMWLRGPLREWAETLLSEDRLRREGYFDASLIRNKWEEHVSGKANWGDSLWGPLMFQAWLDSQA